MNTATADISNLDRDIAEAPEVFGFRRGQTGGHTARSMMLVELRQLCSQTPPEASREDYDRAILEDNLVSKPTESSRVKTWRHLRELYTLDVQFTLFRVLRRFAALDEASLPLMALVCTFCRDAQLRHSFSLVKTLRVGEILSRDAMEEHLESGFPERFSAAMKKSLAQNVNTSWTAAGHLQGRSRKIRRLPECRPIAAAYAMLAGYLLGLRGHRLVHSPFGELVAANPALLLSQLPQAAARGLIDFRHAGGVIDLDCSPLLTQTELSLCHVSR